jgi:hypothetical protein
MHTSCYALTCCRKLICAEPDTVKEALATSWLEGSQQCPTLLRAVYLSHVRTSLDIIPVWAYAEYRYRQESTRRQRVTQFDNKWQSSVQLLVRGGRTWRSGCARSQHWRGFGAFCKSPTPLDRCIWILECLRIAWKLNQKPLSPSLTTTERRRSLGSRHQLSVTCLGVFEPVGKISRSLPSFHSSTWCMYFLLACGRRRTDTLRFAMFH